MALLLGVYFFCFLNQIDWRWFNSEWTTDDAVQQSYIFYEVFEPDIWADDLITTVMRGYLAPVHYAVTYWATYFTGDPIMAGHVVMALQLGLTCLLLCLGIRAFTDSYIPGLFAVIWFLHTRTVVQRLTGGLPRGWAAPVIAGFVYCVATRNHKLMMIVLLVGCMTNPPATFLVGVAYGIWLLWLLASDASRSEGVASCKRGLIFAPILLAVTLYVIDRPPEIGQMVDSKKAYEMPAFGPKGRFAFLPLPPIGRHIRTYGYNAFVMRLYDPGDLVKDAAPFVIFGLLGLFAVLAFRQRRELVPAPLWAFLLAIVSVYLASRQLVFKLYVPDRHLLIPMTFFLIGAFTVAVWRLFASVGDRQVGKPVLGLCSLALLVFIGSGNGLVQDCNFNYHIHRKGRAFEWIRENTPRRSIIAGHPTHINPVMLFSKRRGYVTSEVAHPFYPKFYNEMERRWEVSLRAHYALTVNDFLALLRGENIDYYVFSRMRFYGKALKTETFFRPLDTLVEELTSRPHTNYAYKLFPKKVSDRFPAMTFGSA